MIAGLKINICGTGSHLPNYHTFTCSSLLLIGMIDSNEGGPFLLDADQGDSISGYMGRDEVADLVMAALEIPEVSVGKVWGR